MIPVIEAGERYNSKRLETETYSLRTSDIQNWGVEGNSVSENSSLTLSAFWAGVTLISEAMSVMPLKVWRTNKSGGRDHIDDHPVNYIFKKTNNGWQIPSAYKSYAQGCLLLSGNMVGEIVRNGRGQAVELHPWLPRNTEYRIEANDTPSYGVNSSSSYSEYRRGFSATQTEWFPYTEVVHLKGFSTDGFLGRSILKQAKSSLNLSIVIEQFGTKYFNKGRPTGFLTKAGNMSKDQRELLRQEWKELYEGVENALSVGVLSNGLEWKQMGFSNDDAQFLQSRQFQVLEVSRWLRVPPHMLSDRSGESDVSLEQRMLEFIIFTLFPWMGRQEEEYNLKLFTPREQYNHYVEHDFEAFLRGDKLTASQVEQNEIRNGTQTVNEIRIKKGRNPYETIGDKPLIIASQLDTLENVYAGKSGLQGGGKASRNGKDLSTGDKTDNSSPTPADS